MQNWLEIGQELCSNLFDLKLNFPLPPSVHICEKCREFDRIWNILCLLFTSSKAMSGLKSWDSLISYWQVIFNKKILWPNFFLFFHLSFSLQRLWKALQNVSLYFHPKKEVTGWNFVKTFFKLITIWLFSARKSNGID